MKQNADKELLSTTHVWVAERIRHQNLPLKVSVVNLIPTGGNFILAVFETP